MTWSRGSVGCREYWFWVTLQRTSKNWSSDVRLRWAGWWGLDQNVAFKMDKWLKLKTQNWILPTSDPFPLIVSHIDVQLLSFIIKKANLRGRLATGGFKLNIHSMPTYIFLYSKPTIKARMNSLTWSLLIFFLPQNNEISSSI